MNKMTPIAAAILLSTAIPSVLAETATEQDANKAIQTLLAHVKEQDKKIEALNKKLARLEAKDKKVSPQHAAKVTQSIVATETAVNTKPAPKAAAPKKYIDASTSIAMLKARQKAEAGQSVPDTQFQIGGNVAASASYTRAYTGNKSSDANLSGATVGVAGVVGNWLSGQAKFSYDSAPPKVSNPPQNGDSVVRASNSRVFLSTAFLTIGNLNQSPVYASAGQMVLPFNGYTTSFATPSLTTRLGQIRSRALLLGYQSQGETGLYGSIYGFKGDSHIKGDKGINNGGAQLGYIFGNSNVKLETNVGYVINIADSAGMQNNQAPLIISDDIMYNDDESDLFDDEQDGESSSTPSFTGFGSSRERELLGHRVGGINAAAKLTINPITLMVEYTGATNTFAQNNMEFNGEAAKPRAVNLEAAYNFNWLNSSNTFAIGYSKSFEALALNLPEQTYSVGYKRNLWKNLSANLTYKHEINYGEGNYATGQNAPVIADKNLGKTADSINAQLSLSFAN